MQPIDSTIFVGNVTIKTCCYVKYYFWQQELQAFNSIKPYTDVSEQSEEYKAYLKSLQSTIGTGKPIVDLDSNNLIVYSRKEGLKGGMLSFGYDYFGDHYPANKPEPKLLSFNAPRGNGTEYAYETLNLVNGQNTISDIRNILSAEFGPIPIAFVRDYLEALKSIDVIKVEGK